MRYAAPLRVPLFLTQLPQDRLNSNRGGPLTDCRRPVEIASFCLTAADDLSPALSRRQRQELGVRLFRIVRLRLTFEFFTRRLMEPLYRCMICPPASQARRQRSIPSPSSATVRCSSVASICQV